MNFETLTDELSDLYMGLKAGKIEPALAHELNNTAMNIQGVIRLGLLNAKLQNSAPDLKFFKKSSAESRYASQTKSGEISGRG